MTTERRIYRRLQLPERTGLPISTIYDKIAKGEFPRPIKLGERASGWLEEEIAAWEQALIVKRDAA